MQPAFTPAQIELIENLLVTHSQQQREAALRHGATTLSARPHQAAEALANEALFVIERAKFADSFFSAERRSTPPMSASRLAGVI